MNSILTKDKIVLDVMNKYKERSILGTEKYGTTLYDNDLLGLKDWLVNIQQELMDATNYIQKVLEILNTN